MFKKSESKQFDLFESIEGCLSERKQKIFSDPSCWHNTFYSEVICRIDESIFSVLYSSKMGRGNAPIRVLLGMCILKEGNGWSDEQLFRHCRFDLQVMRSLGYTSMKEDIPVEATYYSFRKAVKEYEQITGIDLIDECFTKITSGQIESYKVSGEKVRMDSKLINSNIRRSTRLEMILEAVRLFTTDKTVEIDLLWKVMHQQDYKLLKLLKKKTVSNITYCLDKKGEKELLHRLGFILEQLLSYFPKSKHYSVVNQIFKDHYDFAQEDSNDKDNDKDVSGLGQDQSSKLKDSKEVKSDSIQSIHDPDAAYRTKGQGGGKQNITGYHANITESCGKDNTVNLILSVEVAKANVSESEFLLPSINASEKVLEQANPTGANKIKQVTNDGGYDSVENREVMSKNDSPSWNMSKTKGRELIFEFSYNKEGQLIVKGAKTKESYQINYSEKLKKYVIIGPNKARRYFTKQQIDNYIFLQKMMAGKTEEDKKLRPNVESAIHQTFHRLEKRKKIKYRGLLKCKTYVYFRAIWVNFSRILKENLELGSFLIILLLTALTNHLIGINPIYQKNS